MIYLNGKEFLRVRMPVGAVDSSTFATQNVSDAVYEGPVAVPASFLQPGDNIVAVEVHQSNTNSSDITFGLSIQATLPSTSSSIVLNEVAARNTGSVPYAGTTPDWIELFNTSNQSTDLAGYSLSDDVLKPRKYVFPNGTVVPAGGYLTVWCDDEVGAPGLHSGFKLNDKSQTVTLFGPDTAAPAIQDYVAYGPQVADLSIGRVPDGAGNWQLNVPTPGAANRPQPLAPSSGLKINEWMAAPDTGSDWLELFNPAALPVSLAGLYLTDNALNPTNSRLAALSFVGAHDYLKLIADEQIDSGADHLGFKLKAAGQTLRLFDTNGVSLIDQIQYGAQTSGVSQGRLPDGSDSLAYFPASASPGASNHPPVWELQIQLRGAGALVLSASGVGLGLVTLQASTDLVTWTNVAVHPSADGPFEYQDPQFPGRSARYYRVIVTP